MNNADRIVKGLYSQKFTLVMQNTCKTLNWKHDVFFLELDSFY